MRGRQRESAVFLREHHAEESELAHLADQRSIEVRIAVPLGGVRRDLGLRELARSALDLALLLGERNQRPGHSSPMQGDAPRVNASGIFVEPPARLSAEPSRRDVFPQQRTWAVLRVAEAILQDLEYGHACVEPDEIGERERPHRMIHAELHDGIDRLGAARRLP